MFRRRLLTSLALAALLAAGFVIFRGRDAADSGGLVARTAPPDAAPATLEAPQPRAYTTAPKPPDAGVVAPPGEDSPACEVFLVLADEDRGIVGRTCTFIAGGRTHQVVLESRRARLGAFAGGLFDVLAVGQVTSAESLRGWLLPRTGTFELRWAAAPDRRTARLLFRGPQDQPGVPRVALAPMGGLLEGFAADAQATEQPPSLLEVAVEPGELVYLASSGDRWAMGEVPLLLKKEPYEVPLEWKAGCRLTVAIPAGNRAKTATAYVISDPGHPGSTAQKSSLLCSTSEWEADMGRIEFMHELTVPDGLSWPEAAVLADGAFVWTSVPRGCLLRVVVEGSRWGTLVHDVIVPADAATLRTEIPVGTEVVLRFERADGTVLSESVTVRLGDVPRPKFGEGFDDAHGSSVDGRLTVMGYPPGSELSIDARTWFFRGSADTTVRDALLVPVVMRPRPQAVRRVRVVDETRRPLPGVQLAFRTGHLGDSVIVTTDERGRADRELPADAAYDVEVVEPGWTSEEWGIEAGVAGVDVVAFREGRLVFDFDVGHANVHMQVLHGLEEHSGHTSWVRKVRPGSTLSQPLRDGRRVGIQGAVSPALVDSPRVRVRVADAVPDQDDPQVWFFDRVVDVAPAGNTVVRVTR